MNKTFVNKFGSVISAVLLALPLWIEAQEVVDLDGKRIQINFTDTPPRIDGDISDEAWNNATKITDLHQMQPFEYREASELTEIYIIYGKDAIYVGFFAHDSEPDKITRNVLDPGGALRAEDKINLILDPFNNQRSGYQFQVNPNGVRSEAIYLSGTRPSFDWEGIWNAAAKVVEGGWTGEMEIPFKSISFDPNNDLWGLNFYRHVQRKQEIMAWYSLNGEGHPATSGKMRGINQATQGVGLDVVPALAGNYFKDHEEDISESEVEPSLDLFYKINPQVNLAVTLNTDFSATEADDNSLNLSRFRRFFEEKRAFFLNDFDTFKYGVTDLDLNGVQSENNALAFYSRRIGLSEAGQPVDIVGGAKLSGRIGNTEFGTLVMRQDEHIAERDGVSTIIDPTNVVVARLSQPIFGESKVGAIYTQGNPTENQSNSLLGADFNYRDTNFYATKSLNAVLLYQRTDDPDFSGEQDSYTAAFSIDDQQGWAGGGQYFVVEENYSPGLGFTQRINAELFSGSVGHTWLMDNWVQELKTDIDFVRWNDLDTGELDTEELTWGVFRAELARGDEVSFDISRNKEIVEEGDNPTGDLGFSIPAGRYDSTEVRFEYEGPSYWSLSPGLSMEMSDYYTGDSIQISPSIDWQVNRNINLSASYDLTQFDLPEGTVYAREVSADISVSFNSSVTFTSSVEYNNVNSELAFNNRLRWNLEPGQDLWIVFNQGRIEDEEDDYHFQVVDTSAAFKFVYTFRY